MVRIRFHAEYHINIGASRKLGNINWRGDKKNIRGGKPTVVLIYVVPGTQIITPTTHTIVYRHA